MTTLTPRQLLKKNKASVPAGPTLDIDADILLEASTLGRVSKVLVANRMLVGLTVVDTDGQSLGVLPVAIIKEYIRERLKVHGDLGPIDHLHGIPVVHLYRCEGEVEKKHEPHQRISFSPPRCPVTGRLMEPVEG